MLDSIKRQLGISAKRELEDKDSPWFEAIRRLQEKNLAGLKAVDLYDEKMVVLLVMRHQELAKLPHELEKMVSDAKQAQKRQEKR